MTRVFTTSAAFKQALEQRLRNQSGDPHGLVRLRQVLVFARFLARVVAEFGDAVVLKGGFGLELRLAAARATRDIDLRLTGNPVQVLRRLQLAGERDLADYFRYRVDTDPDHPTIVSPGMLYEGQRYRAVCSVADKPYGYAFGIDVAFGDPIYGEPDIVVCC
jgi:hypothetical protein